MTFWVHNGERFLLNVTFHRRKSSAKKILTSQTLNHKLALLWFLSTILFPDDQIWIQMEVNKSCVRKLFAQFVDREIHENISCLVFGSRISMIFWSPCLWLKSFCCTSVSTFRLELLPFRMAMDDDSMISNNAIRILWKWKSNNYADETGVNRKSLMQSRKNEIQEKTW